MEHVPHVPGIPQPQSPRTQHSPKIPIWISASLHTGLITPSRETESMLWQPRFDDQQKSTYLPYSLVDWLVGCGTLNGVLLTSRYPAEVIGQKIYVSTRGEKNGKTLATRNETRKWIPSGETLRTKEQRQRIKRRNERHKKRRKEEKISGMDYEKRIYWTWFLHKSQS